MNKWGLKVGDIITTTKKNPEGAIIDCGQDAVITFIDNDMKQLYYLNIGKQPLGRDYAYGDRGWISNFGNFDYGFNIKLYRPRDHNNLSEFGDLFYQGDTHV